MKILLLVLFILPVSAFSQTASDLFLKVPGDVVKMSEEARKAATTEVSTDFVKLQFADGKTGEFKVISRKKDTLLVGMAWKDCDQSDIRFWQVKKGVWKENTKSILAPLGKKDVVNILAASPSTIESLDEQLEISFFYTFETTGVDLQLIARKQSKCEIAGKVYDYKFNGKKYSILK